MFPISAGVGLALRLLGYSICMMYLLVGLTMATLAVWAYRSVFRPGTVPTGYDSAGGFEPLNYCLYHGRRYYGDHCGMPDHIDNQHPSLYCQEAEPPMEKKI